MPGISDQLRKYFLLISILSIVFVTIFSNIGINIFFSKYIKEVRSRDDFKIVKYAEQVYSDNNKPDAKSLMNITHYAFSEGVIIRIRDKDTKIIWNSSTEDKEYEIFEKIGDIDSIIYKNYSFSYKGSQVGTIDIGRPASVLSTFEDKKFLSTMNSVFAIAFLFSVVIALLSGMRISRKFLNPIYTIRENAKIIENGNYKMLSKVNTNTRELYDLSVSVSELADKLDYQESLRKRLTSDIAHELRTPLAIVQSHIEAFMDKVWEPEIERLSVVHSEVTRLTNLIKELSDLSIIESDEIILKRSKINLSTLLNNLSNSFEQLFINKNIKLYKEIMPDIELFGDANLLNRVFMNILSNAGKYTNENGSVAIKLEQINNSIKIVIEDTGIGIPKDDIKYIFERFYRSDMSRNRGTGGTGIGLTIAKALVDAHDGAIRIESEAGKGTKVMIDFKQTYGC